MKTLVELLADSGVSLAKNVGVIVEEQDESGNWVSDKAYVARVCTDAPDDEVFHSEIPDYDPMHDLILSVQLDDAGLLCVLGLTSCSEIHGVKSGGFIFVAPGQRISVAQSEHFMNSVSMIRCDHSKAKH